MRLSRVSTQKRCLLKTTSILFYPYCQTGLCQLITGTCATSPAAAKTGPAARERSDGAQVAARGVAHGGAACIRAGAFLQLVRSQQVVIVVRAARGVAAVHNRAKQDRMIVISQVHIGCKRPELGVERVAGCAVLHSGHVAAQVAEGAGVAYQVVSIRHKIPVAV